MTDTETDLENDNTKSTTRITNWIEGKFKLVNVQYPGFVKNLDKAMDTLGGIKNIECVVSNDKKYLGLSLHPENLHSTPLVSDRDTKPHILLKVKTRKAIQDGKVVSKEVIDYDFVGFTALNLRFQKLCDFQYLPLVSRIPKAIEGELEYVYDRIIPKQIPDSTWFTCPNGARTPLYFVPYQFTKFNLHGSHLQFDRSQFYEGCFDKRVSAKIKEQEQQSKLIRKTTSKLSKATILCRFEDDIPVRPHAQSLEMLSHKGFPDEIIDKVHKLFQKRPIWSRNAVLFHAGTTVEQMKFILPTVAFHYVSGPWRIMWVRFGYDPKSDPSSRILQTFDYRVRSLGGCKILISAKRHIATTAGSLKTDRFTLDSVTTERKPRPLPTESSFMLRPGLIPAARQMFFQYADVKLADIENMLEKLPEVLPGTPCNYKHGWLPNGFADQCREIVNKYVQEFFARQHQPMGPPPPPPPLPRDPNSSSSSSESEESDGELGPTSSPPSEPNLEEIIDLETVEEINQLLGNTSVEEIQPQPGPSSAL